MNRLSAIFAIFALSAVLVACGSSTGKSNSTASTSSTSAGSASNTTATSAPGAQTPAGSSEVSAGVVRASSAGTIATLHATTHHPHVGAHWPISFLVTHNGTPARATVAYEYLFGGAVVAHRSHYAFTGGFHDIFTWPSSAVGYPLTFRAVITTGATTLNLDYPVQVVG